MPLMIRGDSKRTVVSTANGEIETAPEEIAIIVVKPSSAVQEGRCRNQAGWQRFPGDFLHYIFDNFGAFWQTQTEMSEGAWRLFFGLCDDAYLHPNEKETPRFAGIRRNGVPRFFEGEIL